MLAGRTCHFVGFVMRQLILCLSSHPFSKRVIFPCSGGRSPYICLILNEISMHASNKFQKGIGRFSFHFREVYKKCI